MNGLPSKDDVIVFQLDFYGQERMEPALGDKIALVRFLDDSGNEVLPVHHIHKANHDGSDTEMIRFDNGISEELEPFWLALEGTVGGR